MKKLFVMITVVVSSVNVYADNKWTDYSQMFSNYAGKTVEGGMWGWEAVSGQPSNVRGIRYGNASNWPQAASVEVFELQKASDAWCNDRWIRLKGDSSVFEGNTVFAEYRMTKEVFYNEDNPHGVDITNECGGSGEHYVLQTIPSKPYRIHAWGSVYVNNIKQYDFFHFHKWDVPVSKTNPNWHGLGSSTRLAIPESESWWDSLHGWYLNGRKMPEGSMGVGGNPNGYTVPIARTDYIGYQAGRQWYIATPSISWETWLYSSWNY